MNARPIGSTRPRLRRPFFFFGVGVSATSIPYSISHCDRSSLLASDAAARSLAGARVGAGALAAHRQVAAVTQSAVRADVDQALDIHLHFAAESTLDPV